MKVKVTPLRPKARQLASNRLRRLRCELGLSQESVALLCGVSPRSYGAWERGEVAMPAFEVFCLLEQLERREAA
jgi:transcriptional regulator with XRE-family HTH domain